MRLLHEKAPRLNLGGCCCPVVLHSTSMPAHLCYVTLWTLQEQGAGNAFFREVLDK